jgi:hypothetical protein
MHHAKQHQDAAKSSGGVMAGLAGLLRRRGGESAWPALDGFSGGRTLTLPAGEVFALEGVRLLSPAKRGNRVEPSCEEAWIAGRDGEECWYAVWCPYADRWEILRFEQAQQARREPARALRAGRARA